MKEPATIYIGPRRYWHEYAEQVSLPHHDIANLVRGFTLCRRHGRNSALLLGGLGIRLLDTGTAKATGTTLRLGVTGPVSGTRTHRFELQNLPPPAGIRPCSSITRYDHPTAG